MHRTQTTAILLLGMLTLPAVLHAQGTSSRVAKTFDKLLTEAKQEEESESFTNQELEDVKEGLELATFGNGCFWCTEAVFEELKGVGRVASGYSGGKIPNPTYQQVCTGRTGHAEVIHLEFDPKVISYAKLLEVFWRTHDPTTKNRQGPDVGPQYRSVIFFHNEEQKKLAARFKSELNKSKAFRKPIVTEIAKYQKFYPAENYHQNYFKLHGREPYCQRIIRPKMSKFRRVFKDELARNRKNSS